MEDTMMRRRAEGETPFDPPLPKGEIGRTNFLSLFLGSEKALDIPRVPH
jgi:hypothetical protein